MFTGIVTDIGRIRSIDTSRENRLEIRTSYDMSGVDIGASICCSGICLTVVEKGADWFAVEISGETISKTTLGQWRVDSKINLERALKVGDELEIKPGIYHGSANAGINPKITIHWSGEIK